MRLLRRVLFPAFVVATLPLAAGCEVNPETGRLVFNVVPPSQEAEIGAEAHRQVLAEFGGVYYDPPLAAYVEDVGRKIVGQSRRRESEFRFTILDTPSINAFALPGGYVYVTRGLLALLGSEAELAGVLGHELAHITAKHGAQRLTRMKAEERFCATFVCDFELPVLSDMASVGLNLAFGGFSQDQELEADELGIRYIKAAGYDPRAMTGFLRKLKAHADLEAEIAGLTDAERKARGYSSTHPLTEDRISRAVELATAPSGQDDTGRRAYLLKIDGLLYGNRREYGFVVGNSYLHPIRRVAFDVPPGYSLYPDSRRVTAVGPDGAIMLFEPSRRLVRGPVLEYLRNVWAESLELRDARPLTVNGMEAATGWLRRDTNRGPVDYRLVAVRVGSGVIYRFLFIAPSTTMPRLGAGMRGITYSFREIDELEAETLQPLRIRITSAAPGETLTDLAAQSGFTDHAARRLAVLNDLDAQADIEPGRILKTVGE